MIGSDPVGAGHGNRPGLHRESRITSRQERSCATGRRQILLLCCLVAAITSVGGPRDSSKHSARHDIGRGVGQFPTFAPARTADGKPDLNGLGKALSTPTGIWRRISRIGSLPGAPRRVGRTARRPERRRGRRHSYRPEALRGERPLRTPRERVGARRRRRSTTWRSGAQVLDAGRAPFDVHAVSAADRPDAGQRSDTHEFNGSSRIVRMTSAEESPVDNTFFMGWSRGAGTAHAGHRRHRLNEKNWLDRGQAPSTVMGPRRRTSDGRQPLSPMVRGHIEDPKVFTGPGNQRPLYRRMESPQRAADGVQVSAVRRRSWSTAASRRRSRRAETPRR